MSETRQIRLLERCRQGVPGKILSAPIEVAAQLVEDGIAEYADATPSKAAPRTATRTPPENAMKPRARSRKAAQQD